MFVKAALNSVLMGGAMAAALTALMILLFLGNWRLTIIILAAIPLSIITAVLFMGAAGQTLNTMTLGGFALAVGILVDNGTVVIENIERHAGLHDRLPDAIVYGAGEVGTPTLLSTLCICIVFVPVFLLQGTAKYLFSPLSLSVIVSLLASLALSFTMVPVLFLYLMRTAAHGGGAAPHAAAAHGGRVHPLRARASGVRARLPALSRGLSRRGRLDAVAGAHHGAGVRRHHAGLAAAVPAARPRFLSGRRCRRDAAARARAARHPPREYPAVLRPGRGGDPPAWSATARSA